MELIWQIAYSAQIRRGLFLPAPISISQPRALPAPTYVAGKAQLDKMLPRASHQAEAPATTACPPPDELAVARSGAFYAAAIWPSGIIPPAMNDSQSLEQLHGLVRSIEYLPAPC